MKLNLRRASALQMAITDQIARTEMPLAVTIGRYDDPISERDKAAKKFTDGYAKKRALYDVLYSIRMKTATASEAAGVSKMLAEIASIDKVIGMLDSISSVSSFAKTDAQLEAAINDLRNEASTPVQYAHLRRESIETSVISENQVKVWKNEIAAKKRERQSFSDSLLDANVKNDIDLADAEVEVLTNYGIL